MLAEFVTGHIGVSQVQGCEEDDVDETEVWIVWSLAPSLLFLLCRG